MQIFKPLDINLSETTVIKFTSFSHIQQIKIFDSHQLRASKKCRSRKCSTCSTPLVLHWLARRPAYWLGSLNLQGKATRQQHTPSHCVLLDSIQLLCTRPDQGGTWRGKL